MASIWEKDLTILRGNNVIYKWVKTFAIPLPDPNYEKNRRRITYQPPELTRRQGRLIALLCGFALWLIGVLYQGLPQASGAREWFRVLSNGALVPGVLFSGISGMMWIAGEGLFFLARFIYKRRKLRELVKQCKLSLNFPRKILRLFFNCIRYKR